MPSGNPNIDPAELAALFAAGALSTGERAEFEAWLSDPSSPLAQALSSLAPAVEALVYSALRVEPPPTIRDSLLGRIATERRAEKAFFIQRRDESGWTDIGIPGARMRTLFIDPERHMKTFLLRMAPGCEIPSHPHKDVEECYILEGDLQTAETVLGPGDYMRAPAGTMHGRSSTKSGCLMLVTAGLEEHEMN